MERILTNRDLYRFVANLIEENEASVRTLARYLAALRTLLWRHRALPTLGPGTFAGVLADAFVTDPLALQRLAGGPRASGFEDVDRTIARQLDDLSDMEDAGILEDELRAFGLEAPSGNRWYNFEPSTYLECGISGAFGGWQEGDDTSRILVPEEIALIGADGRESVVDPHEVAEVAMPLGPITWADVLRFVECGQTYE